MIRWLWLISAILTGVALAFMVIGFLVMGWLSAHKILDLENARWHAQMGWKYPLPPIIWPKRSQPVNSN